MDKIQEEKLKEFQAKWEWVSNFTGENIKVKGLSYNDGFYKAKFITPEGQLVDANIEEDWINDCDPANNQLPGELRGLMRSINMKMKKKTRT